MLKFLHTRTQHYANQELSDDQAGFRKGRGTEIRLTTFDGSQRKWGNSKKKKSTSVSSVTPKPLTVWIIINCGKQLKSWEYQTILPVFWETCMRVKEQQLELRMEQLIGSNWERSMTGLFAVTLFVQSIRWAHEKCQFIWATNWNQDKWEKHQQPQICRWYHSNGRKWRGTKEPLDEGEGREWKS